MSGTSAVPRPFWRNEGFVAPTDAAVLDGVNSDLNAAFGGNLNVGTGAGARTNPTPQGQLASSLTATISDKNAQFLFYVSQVDPAYASGRMQDGIARIYFIVRNPPLSTVVTATCVGAVGTIIPPGASAQATDGNIYICSSGGEIPDDGSIDLQFQCQKVGPITCRAGTLIKIYQMVPGWDTINNVSDGVIGRNVESRAEFELRRSASVAQNSMGMLTSVQGAVLSVADVLDAYVTENPSATSAIIGGISVAAHSLYVAVVGGTDADVAKAIWTKKAPGCGYAAGNTTVTVTDDNSGYILPLPSYSVTFTRPTPVEVVFKLSMANSIEVPADALAQIEAAILAAFTGADNGPRAGRIGGTVFASRFYAGIAQLGAWAQIIKLEVGTGDDATFTASIALSTMTVTGISAGTLAVGQLVQGAGVLPATYIVAQLTGSAGSTGTYTVSLSQTVSSEAMSSIAFADFATMTIGQVPSTDSTDVNLTLV